LAREHPGGVDADGTGRRTGPSGARLGLLLAEDQRVVGEILAELLMLEGYDVDRATGGREALALLRRWAYALTGSDVRMPDVGRTGALLRAPGREPGVVRRKVFVTGDITS
jgi:CheY-like chemotaxis protein